MKVFFLMQYPGYLRYFDSTVALLAERGHHVDVAFDSPRKQAEGLEALAAANPRVRVVAGPPARKDLWAAVALRLRGTMDYARYLHPAYVGATYLRTRMETALPPRARWLTRIRQLPPPALDALLWGFRRLEDAIPISPRIRDFLARERPDVVLVTPLVTDGSTQVDLVRAAQSLGIPVGACIASWDHLTTKGLIRVQPELVAVWNETQRHEAERFHGIAPARVTVTGAQPFDRWFDRQPSLNREAFAARVGLATRPYVLFVGSTASISAPGAETAFVRRWVTAVRASADPALRDAGLLIRPHPYNSAHWRAADLSDLGDVAIWPRHQANPVNEHDRDDYFHSLYYSQAVVGVNTSAMIEASILGKPVFSVLDAAFATTQTGTLHFRYLLPERGGFVRVASTLAEHVTQLESAWRAPEDAAAAARQFVSEFLRPAGIDVPSTPQLVAAIEALAAAPAVRRRTPLVSYLLRAVLRPYGRALERAAAARSSRKDLTDVEAN